jgi:hypothetical protein
LTGYDLFIIASFVIETKETIRKEALLWRQSKTSKTTQGEHRTVVTTPSRKSKISDSETIGT